MNRAANSVRVRQPPLVSYDQAGFALSLVAPGAFFATSFGSAFGFSPLIVISRQCPSFCRLAKTRLFPSGDQDGSALSVSRLPANSTGTAFGSSALTIIKRQFPFDA